MSEMERIMNTVNFFYAHQGYVDVELCSKMANVPNEILENCLRNTGHKESGIKGQWIRIRP